MLSLLLSSLLLAAQSSSALAWAANFQHLGALVGSTLESSPFSLHGRLYIMAAQMGPFAPDGQGHSFFCILDALSGERISCPNSSSGFAFQSAISDAATGTVWVFGSAWDRAQSKAPDCKPWGCGACAQGSCYVGVWSSSDLKSWVGPEVAVQLPGGLTVPNVGVGLVPASAELPAGLPRHQAFMALEAREAGAQGALLAINTGSTGDLSRDWLLLNNSEFAIGPSVGEAAGCPAARWADGFYYVMGGGNSVDLVRSRNLSVGSWELTPLSPVEQGCTHQQEDCSPGAPVARIASGFYTEYWANGSDHGMRAFLQNMSAWNFAANDVDFCDDGNGSTYFIYGTCAQTAPANWTGKAGNFYQLGMFQGTQGQWLASYFQ